MIPMISSMTLFLTIVEKSRMRAMTAMAPTKAAKRTATKPVNEKLPAVMLPPRSSITSATPNEAPLLIPKILGPANGFLKAVCNISPHTASEAPHSMAVMACGKRFCRTMYIHDDLMAGSA